MDQLPIQSEDDGVDRPPAKRQKTALACRNCRLRKVRCSGERPHCTTCIARRETATCTYRSGSVERGEQRHDLPQNGLAPNLGRDNVLVDPASTESAPPQAVDWNGNAITRPPSQASPWNASASAQGPSPPQDSTGSISVNTAAVQRNEPGLSSSAGFLRTILAPGTNGTSGAVTGPKRNPPVRSLADLGMRETTFSNQAQQISSEHMLLPPRREVNRMLQVYRKTHYPIFPLLDLPSFFAEVDAVYQGLPHATDERTFICMLNFIFALATQSDCVDGMQNEGDPTEPYVSRGRKLMSSDMLEGYSFAQIQSILLCAQFLLSTDRPQQCWVLVGLSVRIAESLGLDRPSTAEELKSTADQSLARRVWHVCVAMDRLVAMCLGQRPTSNAHATAFVSLQDDPLAQLQSAPFQDLHLSHLFFSASSKLFDVLYAILSQIYVPEDRNPSEKMVVPASFATTVLSLEERLAKWVEQLPNELKLPDTDHVPILVYVQPAHFLRQRFLQVQMMLYRPGLAALSHYESATPRMLRRSAFLHSASACVTAAQEMIVLCKKQAYASSDSSIQTPWWMNILYIYTAAVAIAAAIMKRNLDQTMDAEGMNQSMDDAINLLKLYGHTRPSARRCLATLTSILQLRSPPPARLLADDQRQLLPQMAGHHDSSSLPNVNGNWAHNYQQFANVNCTIPMGAEDAAFEFLSEQWLMQPQLDSFNYLGI